MVSLAGCTEVWCLQGDGGSAWELPDGLCVFPPEVAELMVWLLPGAGSDGAEELEAWDDFPR